jgi:hypothetical protein
VVDRDKGWHLTTLKKDSCVLKDGSQKGGGRSVGGRTDLGCDETGRRRFDATVLLLVLGFIENFVRESCA